MDSTPTCVAHRLSPAEQRVLACFLAGRLPAGQVHEALARARDQLGHAPLTPDPLPATPMPIEVQLSAAAA